MKRVFSTVLVLLTLLAMTTGTAFAGSALELVEVRNDNGGPTFIFRVTGEFSKSELESGFVQVDGGKAFPLYCVQKDDDTVLCHTSRKTGGHAVVVGFGGARFWVDVPDQREQRDQRDQQSFCYPVYDWNYVEDPIISTYWVFQGTNCQDSEAQYGDMIYDFYNPDWDNFYDFEYLPGDFCEWADPGEGYYYPACPSSPE